MTAIIMLSKITINFFLDDFICFSSWIDSLEVCISFSVIMISLFFSICSIAYIFIKDMTFLDKAERHLIPPSLEFSKNRDGAAV